MISVRSLSHAFGTKQVLKDINLEVSEGEIVAIMGSSGGGKTTLLRCIAGLINAIEGEVTVR
jgi:ABC-type sugar transport system ATPase subunit